MEYFKEVNGNLLIRMLDSGEMQRYDRKQGMWVRDQSMAQIFYGGIIANTVDEAVIKEAIKNG